MKEILESHQIIQTPLYVKNKKILVVGAPIVQKGNVVAIVYFYFELKALEETWGITEEEFLQIDFNAG